MAVPRGEPAPPVPLCTIPQPTATASRSSAEDGDAAAASASVSVPVSVEDFLAEPAPASAEVLAVMAPADAPSAPVSTDKEVSSPTVLAEVSAPVKDLAEEFLADPKAGPLASVPARIEGIAVQLALPLESSPV
eukprot:CAMPEP_0168404314 /NCGR_PEP_ID=MMETSP0228-20121227/24576_1 /TAXON_ID=133427 /ORGANISM="Protoceratium reticulatum, Strain CCCM 535 (=CCMP 1889)" /LENGTH=133 /DNA_ID=CAMNT_0008417935 /DNA_START=31 /DNA_END=433 /DNA_ORIENTATION=+